MKAVDWHFFAGYSSPFSSLTSRGDKKQAVNRIREWRANVLQKCTLLWTLSHHLSKSKNPGVVKLDKNGRGGSLSMPFVSSLSLSSGHFRGRATARQISRASDKSKVYRAVKAKPAGPTEQLETHFWSLRDACKHTRNIRAAVTGSFSFGPHRCFTCAPTVLSLHRILCFDFRDWRGTLFFVYQLALRGPHRLVLLTEKSLSSPVRLHWQWHACALSHLTRILAACYLTFKY